MLDQSVNPGDPPPNPQDFAIVVGIDHYPDFLCLRGATADAKDFESWLLDPLGGGLPRANCKTILSQDYPACPPRASHRPEDVEPRLPIQTEIDKAFKAIRTQLGKGKGRRLYVYFSGHGLGRDTLGADLCMAQWSKDFWRNAALDSEDYQKKVIASGYFRELVFFLDCCRVREVNARGRGSEFDWPMTGEGAQRAGQVRTFVGFATEFSNPAREAVVAGATGEGGRPLVRGYFTRALLDALRGGAARTGGGVTASELKKYLERETPLLAQRDKRAQMPEVINGMSAVEGEEPVFGRYPPRARFLFHFRNHHRGPIVLEGPDTQMIQRWDASQSPVEHSLSAGWLYVLRDEATGDEKVLRVRAVEGLSHVEF